MTETEKKVPELRFKGFVDDWEQRKLIDVADIFGGGTPSTTISDYWDGEIDWYSPVEIGEQVYVNGSQKKLTELGLKKSSAKVLPVGTVLFTSRAGIGKTAILAKEGATNQGFQSIVPHKNTLDSYFIYSRTNELKRYGEIQGAGSTFVEVSGKQMAKMPILIPILEEQTKIGAFFKKLDDTITLHQRKPNLLKQLKQTYLRLMFPQNEENSPALRFAGFSNPWEQCKLGDLSESLNYGLNASASEFDGENKYIRITDIDDNSHRFIQHGLTSPNTDLSNADDYLLKEGDILFARTGASVGKTYQYDRIDGKVYYAGFLIRARISPAFNSNFIFQNSLTSNYHNFIKITSQRSGQPGVNAQEYANFSILVPKREEQDSLGNFFKQLDYTIALNQQKVTHLQSLKSTLLNKMFI